MDESLMKRVIGHAADNIKIGGGPFAAAVVRNGEIISLEGNGVTRTCDPTAHAEVRAIRAACTKLNAFQLDGCDLYTSCYPCPMCFGACYWARVSKVYYAATAADAADAGFDDRFIYDEINLADAERKIPFMKAAALEGERNKPFEAWRAEEAKTKY